MILRAFRTCSTPRLHELFDVAELTFTTVLNRTVPKLHDHDFIELFTFTTVLNRTVPKPRFTVIIQFSTVGCHYQKSTWR